MKTWAKRSLISVGVLIVLCVIVVALLFSMFRGTPQWYRAVKISAAEREKPLRKHIIEDPLHFGIKHVEAKVVFRLIRETSSRNEILAELVQRRQLGCVRYPLQCAL